MYFHLQLQLQLQRVQRCPKPMLLFFPYFPISLFRLLPSRHTFNFTAKGVFRTLDFAATVASCPVALALVQYCFSSFSLLEMQQFKETQNNLRCFVLFLSLISKLTFENSFQKLLASNGFF